MRTQSFSPIQVVVYFGTPALESLALVIALGGVKAGRWRVTYL
jgi:hypothetical protein